MNNNTYASYDKKEYMSGDALYKYLRISKRKMKYLLENGYIPYIDTGKRTHRYIVKISDAEQFKIKLENDAVLAISLEGRFGNKKTNDKQMVSEQESEEFKKYLHKKWKSEPDAMPTKKVAQLTGYAPQRIIVLCEKKEIFSIKLQSKLYCSKQSVINYFGSVKMMGKPNATKGYSMLLEQYKMDTEKP